MTRFLLFVIAYCSCAANAQPVQREILSEKNVESAYPRLSKDGDRILYQSNRTGKWQLYIMDVKSGRQTRLTSDNYNNNLPDWSADNKYIAFVSDRDGNEEIYTMTAEGKEQKRLTNNTGRDIHPYFSPDGKYLLFNSTRINGTLDIFRMELGTGKIIQLVNTKEYEETCARYSRDMKKIVFLRNNEASDDIYIMDLKTGLTANLTNTPHVEHGWPVFSPDDQWIYYSSRAKHDYAVYRQAATGGQAQQITEPGQGHDDARPFISADGKTLLYNKTTGTGIAIYMMPLS
jgi:tol-pal system beta propeller repeat protein TolB